MLTAPNRHGAALLESTLVTVGPYSLRQADSYAREGFCGTAGWGGADGRAVNTPTGGTAHDVTVEKVAVVEINVYCGAVR